MNDLMDELDDWMWYYSRDYAKTLLYWGYSFEYVMWGESDGPIE